MLKQIKKRNNSIYLFEDYNSVFLFVHNLRKHILDLSLGMLQDNAWEDHCNPFVVSVMTVQQEKIEKFITL